MAIHYSLTVSPYTKGYVDKLTGTIKVNGKDVDLATAVDFVTYTQPSKNIKDVVVWEKNPPKANLEIYFDAGEYDYGYPGTNSHASVTGSAILHVGGTKVRPDHVTIAMGESSNKVTGSKGDSQVSIMYDSIDPWISYDQTFRANVWVWYDDTLIYEGGIECSMNDSNYDSRDLTFFTIPVETFIAHLQVYYMREPNNIEPVGPPFQLLLSASVDDSSNPIEYMEWEVSSNSIWGGIYQSNPGDSFAEYRAVYEHGGGSRSWFDAKLYMIINGTKYLAYTMDRITESDLSDSPTLLYPEVRIEL